MQLEKYISSIKKLFETRRLIEDIEDKAYINLIILKVGTINRDNEF